MLIYAQRPEATACASFDVWNKRMNRTVRRGSRGIALIDTTEGNPKIRYVFDIADTEGRDKSRRPYLWQYDEEHTDQITAVLADTFGVAADNDLPYQLEVIADDLAGEYWVEHHADILACVPGSFLEEYDEFNIEAAFRSAACASTTYALLSRCGLNPDEYFSHEDFMNVFDFNTPDAATALGTAVSENSEQVLRQIEIAIKNYERARRAERSNEHGEQLNLPAGGDFLLPELDIGTPSILGKYGRMREQYLREHRPVLYNRLILSGKLTEHLVEIDQTVNRRLEQIMPQVAQSMGISEQMKASDPMKWVGLMNNAKSKVEEMILKELVYQ